MKFHSTNRICRSANLSQAILKGLAPDGGLFVPEHLHVLDAQFFSRLPKLTLPEIAFEVGKNLLGDEIPIKDLEKIAYEAFTFDAPLVQLSEQIFALELFHGPTLSFKDFGAQFMGRLVHYFNQGKPLHILTATSGDTGSAVAQGFLKLPGIHVWILYPKGKISQIQEQQLATTGQNVTALEVEGTFDDCQALVKKAFNDPDLKKKLSLTSANSINIARLIPQTFYYFFGAAKLLHASPLVISVPSGNFGNLTAGLLAKKLGLPIARFIAATNINDTVPELFRTGHFSPRPSIPTLSNAMDVGNPSNLARMLALYDQNLDRLRQDIFTVSFTDPKTEEAIEELHSKYGYVADPHGAVGYLGLKTYMNVNRCTGIFLETAHPAKFIDVVQPLVKANISLPVSLQEALQRPKQSVTLANNYEKLVQVLTSL